MFSGRLVDLILEEPVRPANSNGVDCSVPGKAKKQRRTGIDPFLVEAASFYFDYRAGCQLQVLHAVQTHGHPMRLHTPARDLSKRAIFTNYNGAATSVGVETCVDNRHA